MILCTYEDRADAQVGLRLLIASLKRHLPDAHLLVFGTYDASFTAWAASYPVTIRQPPPSALTGWDAKPAILLDVLPEAPSESVVWVDSDVVLTGDITSLVDGDHSDVLVATEEHPWVAGNGVTTRTAAIGLTPARAFGRAVNTSVLRVTSSHVDLLKAWQDTLARPDYREAQSQSFEERRWYLGGDQDMLSALLGAQDFSDVPVKLLRSGVDIAHCFLAYGYGVRARLRNLGRLPPIVHAQGPKPWDLPGVTFAELSPYAAVGATLADDVDTPIPWTKPSSPAARFWDLITFGSPNLRGLPLCAAAELRLLWRRSCRRDMGMGSAELPPEEPHR